MDLLNDLNEAQRKAVEYIDGPSLVIAGAGSGKTRVLTYKIAYLLQQGMKPWSIMALTFTNKAAKEMRERINRLVGGDLAAHLYMGTFHSIFSRILRAEADHIGFNNNFTIYDESDSRSLLKAIIKEKRFDDKIYKPAAVHAKISMAKNNLVTPEIYRADKDYYDRDKHANMPGVGEIYEVYVQRCKQANAMDFDDLLMLTFQLFRDHEEIRQKYSDRFDFILVDEYQDTNHVQMKIVMQLCKEKNRVCAVGDDSQSIYSFRGANIDNILRFQSQLKGAKLFKLEQNYRSTQNIVYSDFAILYRTNAQSRSFEEEFRKQGVPYRIYGGMSFYQRKEIKDIIAYFRLVANPDDEEAFKRIINYPARGIGNTTVAKIAACALANQVSFWEVISEPQHYGLAVNKGTLTKLDNFRLLISGFIEKADKLDIYELGDSIIKESGISKDIFEGGKDAENLARQENLEEFLSGMQTFVEERKEEDRADEVYLTDYLQDVALLTDLDSKGDDDAPRVSLMTVHAAKGLEFPTVFIVGLEENIFPSPIAAASMRELEEERRLLYVAITRAEKHCILTNAKNRFRYGKMEFDNPSRFLHEIDPKLIENDDESVSSSAGGGYGNRMPWDRNRDNDYRSAHRYDNSDDYRSARRYDGDSDDYRYSHSPRPVATQFIADPKPSYSSRSSERRVTSSMSEHAQEALASGRFKSVRGVNAVRRILGKDAPMSDAQSNDSANSASGIGGASVSTPAGLLKEGNRIEHQRFGVGMVVKLEGKGENAKATVEFVNSGSKQLLLKFAKFTIIQ